MVNGRGLSRIFFGIIGVTVAVAQPALDVSWDPEDFAFLPGSDVEFHARVMDDREDWRIHWQFDGGDVIQGNPVTWTAQGGPGYMPLVAWATLPTGESTQPYVAYLYVQPKFGDFNFDVTVVDPEGPTAVREVGARFRLEARCTAPDATVVWQVPGAGAVHEGAVWDIAVPEEWVGHWLEFVVQAVRRDGAANPVTTASQQRILYVFQGNHPPHTEMVSPLPNATGLVHGRVGETLTFHAAGEDPDGNVPLSFSWRVTDEAGHTQEFSGSADGRFTVTPSQSGRFLVQAFCVDALGVPDPFGAHVTVSISPQDQAPSASFSFVHGEITVPERALELLAEGADPEGDSVFFRWDPGDGRSPVVTSHASFSMRYPQPGVYPLTLVVVDEHGTSSAPFTRWVVVNPSEDFSRAPRPAIQRPLDGTHARAGDTVECTARLNTTHKDVSYYWGFSDGQVLQGNRVEKTFQVPFDSDVPFGVHEVRLIARAADGMAGVADYASYVVVFDGPRPPDGKIVAPATSPLQSDDVDLMAAQLRPGESLQLKGEVRFPLTGDYSGLWVFTRIDWDFSDDTFSEHPVFWTVGLEPDPIPFEQFTELGLYRVDFVVFDDEGMYDPLPDEILLWVRGSVALPSVRIAEPAWDLHLKTREPLTLAAWSDDNPDWQLNDLVEFLLLDFQWTLSDGRTLRGQRVDGVRFEAPGLYSVQLEVRDTLGDVFSVPGNRYVVVSDPANRDNRPPVVSALSPSEEQVLEPVGTVLNFACEASDPDGDRIQSYFWDFGNGVTRTEQAPGLIRFDVAGVHAVRAYAKDERGRWSDFPRIWEVFLYEENIPPDGVILSPPLNEEETDPFWQTVVAVPLGDGVDFDGLAADRDGVEDPVISWRVDGLPVSDADLSRPLVFDDMGQHLVQLIVEDDKGMLDPFPDARVVHVIDLSQTPESHVFAPHREITVEPGRPLRFVGFGEDPNHQRMTYTWNFGPHATPSMVTGTMEEAAEVYPVIFNQESPEDQPFEVTFTVSTAYTQDPTPAVVRVHVKTTKDRDFEPNDSFGDAFLLSAGRYGNMQLSPSDPYDFFLYRVDREQQDLKLDIRTVDLGDTVLLAFFKYQDGTWVELALEWVEISSEAIEFEAVPTGLYAVVVALPDQAKTRKDGLDYGIGITTEQPSFYLPLLVEDGNISSSIGIINPNDELADMAVMGMDADGQIVEQVAMSLAPHSRILVESLSLFGSDEQVQKARMIHWVQVQSTVRLLGYTNGKTQDHRQLMSTAGIRSLNPSLVVPHVAQQTDQWYTRAVLVHAGEESDPIMFHEKGQQVEIANPAAPKTQHDFRFADLFGAQLPQWGAFENANGEATLAGIEVFGRLDDYAMMAGLEMVNARVSNPNFYYVQNTLFFPHVASDVTNFWTGISLINTSDVTINYVMQGFDDQGQEVTRNQGTLEAGGKILGTVDELFSVSEGVSWVKVEGDAGLAGYELFGDHGFQRIAGFKAMNYGSNRLFFPHVQTDDGRFWTGISVLNMGGVNAQLTFRAYNDAGELKLESQTTLGPRTRMVALAAELFPEETWPEDVTYVEVSGDQNTLNGFELFGALNADKTLGETMAGLPAIAW